MKPVSDFETIRCRRLIVENDDGKNRITALAEDDANLLSIHGENHGIGLITHAQGTAVAILDDRSIPRIMLVLTSRGHPAIVIDDKVIDTKKLTALEDSLEQPGTTPDDGQAGPSNSSSTIATVKRLVKLLLEHMS